MEGLMTFENKTVVVIGGSSGLGLATAKATADLGARVVITGRDRERLRSAEALIGHEVRVESIDANDEAGTRALFEKLDRVDHLYVSAATVTLANGINENTSALHPAMDTRFWGSLYAAKYAAPKMPPDGSITFTSGISGWRPRPGASVGSASCGAIEAFGRALAIELAPIRVNTIQPGFIDTPLIESLLGENTGQIKEMAAKRLPVRRVGQPEDIAHAVLFLMTNRFTTGITLTVDGGNRLVG
jgi:NAD(P)-dependent dehydrogenase (short-subunit alcohol dehydrogenase family)